MASVTLGCGNSEKYVGKVRCHVTSGKVGNCAAHSAQKQIDRIGIHPVERAVHYFGNFMIDSFRHQTQIGQNFCPLRD